MHVVICYDVADDRRRTKVRRALKSYGDGAQESVFEAEVDDRQWARLYKKIMEIVEEEDKVRFYFLCLKCSNRVKGDPTPVPPGTLTYRII